MMIDNTQHSGHPISHIHISYCSQATYAQSLGQTRFTFLPRVVPPEGIDRLIWCPDTSHKKAGYWREPHPNRSSKCLRLESWRAS
jgi:hypothetical protein